MENHYEWWTEINRWENVNNGQKDVVHNWDDQEEMKESQETKLHFSKETWLPSKLDEWAEKTDQNIHSTTTAYASRENTGNGFAF